MKNSIASTHPALIAEWHPTRNLPLTPEDVAADTSKKIWWTCTEGHEWEMRGNDMAKGGGCPYCNSKQASETNSLAATLPELAAQWHPTKNLPLTPTEVVAGTAKKIWWQCAEGHEWQATGGTRAAGTGCPFCGA